MPFLDSRRQRAALVVALLGVGIAIALSPYASGLIGAAVLYVIFAPLSRAVGSRLSPVGSASLVTAVAVLLVIFPGASVATLLVNKAQQIAGDLIRSDTLQKLSDLEIAGFPVGPRIATIGEQIVSWAGQSVLGLLGTATRLALNLTIAFFGLYFLLLRPDQNWELFRPYIPFSQPNTDRLRDRFRDVTNSTLIGTFLISVAQGVLIGGMFAVLGISDAVFWGVVTAILAILPVIGSPLVWGPAALALGLDGRWTAAAVLVAWGAIVVGSADNVIRPLVYRRYAQIHPMITLVGAVAGVKYFGLLGILIGPLALSYFFELIRMYREEYIEADRRKQAALSGEFESAG